MSFNCGVNLLIHLLKWKKVPWIQVVLFFLYMLSLVLFWSKGKCYICIRTSVKFFIKPPEDVKTDHLKIARIHITGEVVSHIEKISVDLLRFSENNQKKTQWLHYLKTDLFFLPVTKTFCIRLEKPKKQAKSFYLSVCMSCLRSRKAEKKNKKRKGRQNRVSSIHRGSNLETTHLVKKWGLYIPLCDPTPNPNPTFTPPVLFRECIRE